MRKLNEKGFPVESQERIPLIYKGKLLKSEFKLDIVVNNCIIVELKAVDKIHPVHKTQLLTYLKLTGIPKGLLINFNCDNIVKNGLIPLVTDKFAALDKE